MKAKTNRTLRKILSIALCLALVMSYVPMVSITAGAAESTIPVIEGYGLDSDDSEFGTTIGDSITSGSTAGDTSWCDEAGKGNLLFQWGYGDTLDVTLVDPDGVVTYETSNIQAHSDDSKSSDLHWTEFPLSSSYADGTYITAAYGFENYTNNDFLANGNGSVANIFTQTASGDPSFLSDDMLMYGESIIEDGTTSMFFEHIPATFRFIITNTHEKALSLESVTLRVVDADGTPVPAAAESCNIIIDAENRYPELFYSNFAYSTYDSVTTNLSDYTLEPGKSYIAYALALPLGKVDTGKHDDTAFEGKTIQVGVTTSEGECIALELEADEIANANPNNAYNWVGGKSYTMCMETRCYDGCAFDITGKCTVCGYECTHKFDDKGFCSACDSYQPTTQNEDGYYEISNAGQLYWFAEQVNAGNTGYNAILLNDIIVNENILVDGELNTDTDTAASFRQWTAIGNDTTQYIGTFDGQGYEIKGLYINSAEKQNLGLFGYLGAGAVVKNLGVVDSYFADTSINSSYGGGDSCYGGGIATYANKATISKCYNTCTIKTGGDVGGIVGRNYSSRIEYCYNAGNVICTAASNAPWYPAAGGIAGGNYSTATSYEIIYSCYNIGTISSGFYYIGSINGSLTGCPSQNCYYLSATDNGKGGKTAEQFASGEVAYLLQQGNTEQVWGQDNNQTGAKPMFTSNELYKVVTVGETGNYSVANVGDTNGDGTVDVTDYQALVNMAVSAGHSQTETASYDDIVRYDLNGDGYVDALDAQVMNLVINDMATVDVYAVGDYDLNGVAFEEADILAMAEAMGNPETLATHEKYACDLNADGKVSYDDLNTLTSMFPLYFVGEE